MIQYNTVTRRHKVIDPISPDQKSKNKPNTKRTETNIKETQTQSMIKRKEKSWKSERNETFMKLTLKK